MEKTKVLFIIFFIICSGIFAQHYRVGAGFVAGLPNDNANFSGGFDLFVEYKTETPLSFRTSGGFAITTFKESNPYVGDLNYSLYWLEGSLIYTPIQSDYEPFIGVGIGNYFISAEDFNEVITNTGNYSPQDLKSKFSYHAVVGFIYPLSESMKLNAQVKYLYLPHEIIVQAEETIRDVVLERTFEEDLDLSSIYLTLGLVIKI